MTPTEAAALLAHCSGFDNRQPSVAAAQSWAAALHDLPFDQDTRDAVAAYYTTPPKDPDAKLWILPHHVRTLRTKLRNARLENFQYEPIDGETTNQYLVRLRGQLRAVAAGHVPPQTGRPALEGGPHRQFTDELTAQGWEIGRPVPDSDEQAVIDTVRRAGPLGVRCPACDAHIGRPCKTPGGSEKQPLGKPRLKPHSARIRAAQGRQELSPEQRATEEQRRRDASAAYLARMAANAEIIDAEIVETP